MVALAIAIAGGAAHLAFEGSAEDVLARTYSGALPDTATSWQATSPATMHPPSHFWLSRLGEAPRGGLRRPVAIGDQVSIAGLGGEQQTFEVSGLEELDGEAVGVPGLRLQLVTARPAGAAESGDVRFLLAVEAPMPTADPAPAERDRVL